MIVSAHFDHLGVRGDPLPRRRRQRFGRGDDARGGPIDCAAAPDPPRRSVMFVGFDLEEIGLFGSRYFVAHPPVPLEPDRALHHGRHDRPVARRGSARTRSSCWEPSTPRAFVPGSTRRPRPPAQGRPAGFGPPDPQPQRLRAVPQPAASLISSSAPARTQAIIHRRTGPKRSITRSWRRSAR